jgi:endonuclease/exonuclease/phosphatase family metal-dependent hydrolase
VTAGQGQDPPKAGGLWKPIWAALCFAVLLAQITSVRAADLKVTTWNLEWLTARADGDPELPPDVHPKLPADIATLRHYATALDSDVVALQEVDGPDIAAALFPPDRYTLYFTDDHVIQRVGFAVRRDIKVHRNPDLTALDLYPNARFHLRSGADLTLDLPSGPLRLLGVHLKTGCHFDHLAASRRPQCATLHDQVAILQHWIAARRAEGVPFILVGDFNREMDAQDDVLSALQSSGPLARATEGHDSPCWGGGHFIDHILAGGAARAWLDPESLRVLVYRENVGMKEHLSDHCPVSARFHLPN